MTGSVTITRHVEFDAGHRVPDHQSKCRHPHGHRYRLDVTLAGPVHTVRGRSDDGMVLDFGDLAVALNCVADRYDHAFLVAATDEDLLAFLEANEWRHVIVDGPPTAEVLVECLVAELRPLLPVGVEPVEATLWETPKCRATWSS